MNWREVVLDDRCIDSGVIDEKDCLHKRAG